MAQTPLLDADFFKYGNTMPYVFEKDANGTKVSPSLAYIKNAGGLFVPVSAADPMPVAAGASMVTPAATLQNAVGAVGNGTPMPVAGLATVAFTVSGTFVATVVFEGTTVATNPQPADWFSINAHQSGTTTVGTTATTPGIYRASVAGLVSVRARVSAWTSGTVTVTGTAVAVEDTSKVTAASITGSILTNFEAVEGGTAPAKTAQVGGYDGGGALRAFRMANALPTSGAGGQYMQAQAPWLFNGASFDSVRVANKSARAAFTAATSVVIATPSATKKLNLQGRIVVTGITAGENVDLRDGGITGTILKSKAADAQGNAEFYYPEGGTAGRLSAVNNTLAATWTTAKTGSAHADYNEE